MDERLKWALYGIGGLLILQYGLVGLCQWNSTFHPNRKDDANSIFFYPLLGLIHPDSCDRVTTTITY